MAYTVLARKYRSRTFDEVVGQQPIATTLVNSIKSGRIHHGYLFTGTRGVGKTSMARILAKALNCLASDGPTPTPCLKCDSCIAIAEGQDIDVVEIDAASNTGVENIRELRANTAFRPARARFKIYIIDEVHMLSTSAFNALLKTLEEPPAHVKFILATTEIQKVPATIRSRCQCFNFRNIGPAEIARVLQKIAVDEGAKMGEPVANRIARLANGSMRDALSLLDQLLGVSPSDISPEVLDEILPPAQDEQVFSLLQKASVGDVAGALLMVDEILASGRGLETLCSDAIEVARSLMLIRACGIDAPMIDIPAGGRETYQALAAGFDLSQYVQIIAMLEELRRNVRFSGSGRALTDAVILRIAHMKQWSSIESLLLRSPEMAEKKKSLTSVITMDQSAASRGGEPIAPAIQREIPAQASSRRPLVSNSVYATAPIERTQPAIAVATEPVHRSAVFESSPEPIDDPADFEAVLAAPADDAGESPPPTDERPMYLPVTAEQRNNILRDPVITQALDLFDGIVINLERVVYQSSAAAPEETG